MNMNNNDHLDRMVEKYFNRILNQQNKAKDAINLFLKEITEKTSLNNKNYLHAHPLVIHWGISSECNLRCNHCYYKGDKKRYNSSNDLTTKEALDLIDVFEDLNVYHVKVSGGEPFLREDIFEILKKLKSKNMAIAIQSNGILINKNVSEKLRGILVPEVDVLQISLDGFNKKTHELTRGKGTFDKTTEGIKNLIANDLKVTLSCTATSLNLEEIPKLYKTAQKIGVKTFGIGNFKVCSPEQAYLVPDFKLKLKIMNELIDIEDNNTLLELSSIKLYEFLDNNLGTDYLIKLVNNETKDYNCESIICQKHDRLTITGDGNVYLCEATSTDDFCMGNVKDKSLIEIWNNRCQNVFFNEIPFDSFPCCSCKYSILCKGGCPMEAYKKYKTLNAPDGRCIIGNQIMEKNKL